MTTSMPQCSLMYEDPAALAAYASAREPDIFGDLNLDQVVKSVTETRAGYQLQSYFYVPLHTEAQVGYRHAVLADLQQPAVARSVSTFAGGMRSVRTRQAQAAKLHYRYPRERWLLDAAAEYCTTVQALASELGDLPIESAGIAGFVSYLRGYVASDAFVTMDGRARSILSDLNSIDYSVRIHGSTVTVDDYHGESDYSAAVLATFDRFKQGDVRSHLVEFSDAIDMNHVEAQILDRVALLHPEVFAALDRYAASYGECIDATIANVERETQFFQAYLEFVDLLRSAGLDLTVPEVSATSKEINAIETFDVALANKLVREKQPLVCNDITLSGGERIIVVSGPNQGGKTTFSRTFGQLHYLGSLGLPVPGRQTRMFLPDRIFTHFEREEDLSAHRGKLEDELIRIHDILQAATGRSVVIINEIFSSTTLDDAILLGTKVIKAIVELDLLCVCVTFIDELAGLSASTVSMASTVVPDNPAERTFKVVRHPADGLAYAAAIAQKYGLSYRRLLERVGS